jgi:hypothetical protein
MNTKALLKTMVAGLLISSMPSVLAASDELVGPVQSPINGEQISFQVDPNTAARRSAGGSGGEVEYTQEQINEMINNPLGELWLLFAQNDTALYDGDVLDFLGADQKVFNTTILQPVMPFQLTENIKWIFRPVIPILSFDMPHVSNGPPNYIPGDGSLPDRVNFSNETEMGDIILWNAFTSNEMAKPPNIYGFGFTTMLDTATDDRFGLGKTSVGPMALAFHVGEAGEWILGTVAQHWWDVAGDSDRDSVNLTNIQYVAFYRMTDETNIGFGSPNIVIDWTENNDNRWTIPVGLGFNTMSKIGKLPVKWGMELHYFVEQSDRFGPQWNLRLMFSPIIPSPGFSKKPIFGN